MVSERAATRLYKAPPFGKPVGDDLHRAPPLRRTRYPGRRPGGGGRRPPKPPKRFVVPPQFRRDLRRLERQLERHGVPRGAWPDARSLIAIMNRFPVDDMASIGDLLDRPRMPDRIMNHGSWVHSGGCAASRDMRPMTIQTASNICISALSLNQYPTPGYTVGWTFPFPANSSAKLHHLELHPHAQPTLAVRRSIEVYRTEGTPREGYWSPSGDVWTNPNVQRYMPSIPSQEWPDETRTDALPLAQQMAEPALGQRVWTAEGLGIEPPSRQRVRSRVQERKFISKGKAFAIGVFRSLDAISELSELIDAFYDALPAEVKRKYRQGSRGLIDNAGQYGIDGADWKARAVAENFSQVDVEKAVKNIVNNHLQDQLLGAINKNLPAGPKTWDQGGQKAINDAFQKGWDAVVGK